jgi:hypothetical protein
LQIYVVDISFVALIYDVDLSHVWIISLLEPVDVLWYSRRSDLYGL